MSVFVGWWRFSFVAMVAGLLLGCASREIPGKLYDMKGGRVVEASFMWQGTTSGPTTILNGDERCAGEYRTIMGGATSVGFGTSAGPWGVLFGSIYSGSTIERAQKGIAIALCPKSGTTFECEYITNVSLAGVSGHGACKDNRGDGYRLMF